MRRRYILTLASWLAVAPSMCLAQGQPPKNPTDNMRELRVLGGVEHESVRGAAKRFVKAAERFHNEAILTTDYSEPARDRLRFYL